MNEEIFDADTKKWFKIKRGFFGNLVLEEQIYVNVVRFPVGGEYAYSNCRGLYQISKSKPPPTLQPILVSTRQSEDEKDG